jgi:hypothetical protein
MPRYYFHFTDGTHTFTDGVGIELIGFGDVRRRVISHIREIKGALSEHKIQDWAKWKLLVTESSQITVLEVSFDLKPRPMVVGDTNPLLFSYQRPGTSGLGG